jgi:glycosyltransferase involved in cell wall biosynthesis
MNAERIAVLAPEIHPPFIEGVQKTAWLFIQEFLQQQKEVFVFTEQSFGKKEVLPFSLLHLNYWFTISKFKLLKYGAWVRDGWRIMREVRKQKITQLYVFSLDLPFFFTLFWIFLCASDIQVVLAIFSPREINFLGKMFLKIFKHKFYCYSVRSVYLQEKLLSIGVCSKKIVHILPFPNKKPFMSVVSTFQKRPHSVAYLSNAEATAGVYDMLVLAKTLPTYEFTIAIRKFGDAEEAKVKEVEYKIREEKLPNVILKRTIEDMPTFLGETETVILPVIDQNASMDMPMVMVEALASKCFVIARSIPLFQELIQKKYVIGFHTVEELKKLVELPFGDKKEYSERGFDWAMTLPEINVAAKLYTDLFKK